MMRALIAWLLIPLCLLSFVILPGCTKVGPDFVRPEAAVSSQWMETGDDKIKSEPADYGSWWRAFNDSVLDRLIWIAYRENLPLRIAGVRILEARAQLGVAIGLWYPQMQQAFGYLQRNRTSGQSPQAAFSSQLTYDQSEIGLQASWELDFWGKFRRAIEAGDASLLATIAEYDSALVSLTADVATFYVLIRTLQKRIDIARQNVETQKESLSLAQARYKGGVTSQRDVEQAQTILSSTQALVPALEIALRQAKNGLSVLLGMPPSDLSDLLGSASEIPVPPLQIAVGMPADLLRRRPDIRSAELRAAAQCAAIGVAKAQLYPAFSLVGTFGFLASDINNFSLSNLLEWNSRTGSGGASFAWNVLNYGQITNLVRVQDARFQELLIAYQSVVLNAQQEVEDALVAFVRYQTRAVFLAQSTEAARHSLELVIKQYREGAVDFTSVLVAQQALLVQQDNLADTLGNISRSLVGVYRAVGGGWQIREGQDFVPETIKREMANRTNWGDLLSPAAYTPTAEVQRSLVRPPDW